MASQLRKELNCILKYHKAFAMLRLFLPTRPKGVMRWKKMPLWMWHESENSSTFIAKPCKIESSTVWIGWEGEHTIPGLSIRITITQGDLLL